MLFLIPVNINKQEIRESRKRRYSIGNMKNLKGYIREIKIADDTCVMRKPDLFCKRSGQMKEVAVEINYMCQKLVDYNYLNVLLKKSSFASNFGT